MRYLKLLGCQAAYRKGVLLEECGYFLSSLASYHGYDSDQKSMLRSSCWKGLFQCFDEASADSLEYVSHIEKCMEMLFSLLPALQSDFTTEVGQANHKEEWSDSIRCLAKSQRSWLMNFLEASLEDLLQKGDQFIEVLEKVQAKAQLTRFGCMASSELGKLKAHLLNRKFHGMWDLLIEVVAALQHVEGGVWRQWLIDAVEISCVATYPSTARRAFDALQVVGLLPGSRSKYRPLLILDRRTVLSDLSVTLSSLLSDSGWRDIAESVASSLWASTERIYNWAKHITQDEDTTEMQPIDESENEMACFLLHVMHHTCLSLKNYLPFEKQLKLANMVVD